MLTDQYRKFETIENEHKTLLKAWEYEISKNPTIDTKKSKISKAEHIQFTLMHLFNSYLNQTWADSQNMLQYAEAQKNMNELYPSDSNFYSNIVGLHLMKQSLQTRQELFRIADDLKDIPSSNNDTDESVCSSPNSIMSQGLHASQKDEKKEHMFFNLSQYNESYRTTIDCPKTFDSYFELTSDKDTADKTAFTDSVSSIDSNRPIRLTSSPSTPTISSHWADQYSCSQNFSPACNYTTYFPRIDDNDIDHKLSCHFCQEALPLKKSFSVENLNSFQQNLLNTTDDESEKEEDDNSSFEIASFYYNSDSDNQADVIEREELLKRCNNSSISEKYQLLSDTEGSLKIEIEQNSNSSTSSSIIHYDSKSKQIKKNKISRCRQPVYEQDDMSSTCESSYYSEDKNSSNLKSSISMENKNIINDSTVTVQATSLSNKLRKSKVGTFIRKNSTKRKQDMKIDSSSVARSSFSSKNINLCSIFSTRKLNHIIHQ